YVHLCTNNTIEGTQYQAIPDTAEVPIVADMSSDIASRPLDVKKFGLIFAGAQKNLGPSGVTLVIVRKDLAERADKNLPTIFQYPVERDSRSLMNVVFRVAGRNGQSAATNPDEATEKEFGKQAAAAGLVGTPGHRSVGGIRVSLYNAVEPAAVEALTTFMRDF